MSDPFGRKRSKGVFATLVSKGDWLYTRGEYKKAIESYTTVSSWLLNKDEGSRFITLSSCTNLTSTSRHYTNNLLSSSGSVSEAQRQDLLCRPIQVLPEAGPVCRLSNRCRCFLGGGQNILWGESPVVLLEPVFSLSKETRAAVSQFGGTSSEENVKLSMRKKYQEYIKLQLCVGCWFDKAVILYQMSAKHEFALFKGTVPEGGGALSHGRVWICTNVLPQRTKAAPANRRVPVGHSESHQGHRGHHR